MTRTTHHGSAPSERRRFERVDIGQSSEVAVLEADGKKAGVLRQIGRGGFMMEPHHAYTKDDKIHKLTIHEPSEKIRVAVHARVLYANSSLVGFEFVDLDANAAVDVGIIIGKYYEHEKHPNP
jgi:hypothetical protein